MSDHLEETIVRIRPASGIRSKTHCAEDVADRGTVSIDETVDGPVRRERTLIAGRYVVLGVIAEGSSGRVLRAQDRVLQREVAVKIPRTDSDPDAAEKFLNEARAAAGIRHSGIVAVHDFGQEPDGAVYLVEDLIDGDSLASVINEGPMDVAQACLLMADVAEAVHAAHDCGLIHRDLKPTNILVDRKHKPFVTDFGLALAIGRNTADSGRVSGTPIYMSPEQTYGDFDRIDARSDVWSLGVVLFELLTGARPFPAASIPVLFDQIQKQAAPRPSKIQPGIPRDLDAIVLQCLEKQSEDRLGGASDLARVLRETAEAHAATAERNETDRKKRPDLVRERTLPASIGIAILTFAGFGLLATTTQTGRPRSPSGANPDTRMPVGHQFQPPGLPEANERGEVRKRSLTQKVGRSADGE